jgi:transcriptional regulator with XRE-family HTH domain
MMKSGQFIRKHRTKKNLTLEDMSKLTGLSLSYLSKLERSDRIPPFATLQTLATVLGFDMTELLNPQAEKAEGDADIMILRSEHHVTTEDGNDGYSMIPLTTSYKNTALSPFLLLLQPGQTTDFAHDAEEFIYVLHGELKLVYKGAIYPLKEGDSVYLDSRNVHRFINETTEPVTLLTVNHIYRRF